MKRAWFLFALAACGKVASGGGDDNDPTITAISPDHGPAGGGVTVTVTGVRFDAEDPVVLVGSALATEVAVVSDTELTFTLPSGIEGSTVDVAVANQDGFAVSELAFTYNLAPTVLSVSPPLGRSVGGTRVTIIGRGFQTDDSGVPTVKLGGAEADDVQIVDDQTIMATTTPNTASDQPFVPLDVTVSNANGAGKLGGAYRTTAPGLIASDGRQIFWIDTETAQARFLSRVQGALLHACASNAAGVMFADGRREIDGNVELIKFDPLTGESESVGLTNDPGGVNRQVSGLLFIGTTLFGLDAAGNTDVRMLYSVNTATAALTPIGGALPVVRGHGLAVGSAPNTMIHLDHFTRADGSCPQPGICQLQTLTTGGSVSLGAVVRGTNAGKVAGLATVGGATYVNERDSSRLLRLDTATGAVTEVGIVSFFIRFFCATPPTF